MKNDLEGQGDPASIMAGFSIGSGSRRTYASHIRQIREVTGGDTVDHLLKYICTPELAASISNSTMAQKASAWKEFRNSEHREALSPGDAEFLKRVLEGRRKRIPDIPKMKGAINKFKLFELRFLLDMMLKEEQITTQEHESHGLVCMTVDCFCGCW